MKKYIDLLKNGHKLLFFYTILTFCLDQLNLANSDFREVYSHSVAKKAAVLYAQCIYREKSEDNP